MQKKFKPLTQKRAIKIVMHVTGCGNKRWVNDAFDTVKKHIAGNPSNADVCYRLLCQICNSCPKVGFSWTAIMAYRWSCVLLRLYGQNVGGTLLDNAEECNA